MLLTIRKKSQGWVAWLIVIIIAIPFALFGINSYFEGANQVTVANVDGEKINGQTFERAMEQRRRLFRSQLGSNFNPAMVDNPQFRRQVVEGLVSNQLIQKYARDNGLRLSDKALSERIVGTPQFQADGQFDQDTYRRVLSGRGFTIEGYEQQERVSGGISQIQSGLVDSALVNLAEVDQILALNLQQREADFTVFNVADSLEEVEVSDDELREEYKSNEAIYQQADRIKLDYLALTLENIAKDIELDDEEILAAYEASKGKYVKPETRIASHILLSIPRSADEAAENEVLAKAEDVIARIEAGEDFATLAEELSDDPGSKRKGGDLGVIGKGQMVPEFEEAVYAMSEGELSAPIKTQFGYHIIKLTSLVPESEQALEDVKSEVAEAEKRKLAQAQFSEVAETFRTLVFENPEDLQAAAGDLGLEIQTSDWVTRNAGTGHFTNPNVRAAAFDSAVLDEDLNSEVIEVSADVLVAMHQNEFEAQHTKAFDDVSEQITTSLKNQKAGAIAKSLGEALVEKIALDNEPGDVEFTTLPTLKADAKSAVERQIAEQVFKQKLEEGKITSKGFALNNGDFAVYRLKAITAGKPDEASEEQRLRIVREMQGRDGDNAYRLFRQALREKSDVEVFSSLLEDDVDISPYGG